MIISRTPLRMSFLGGGSDIASYYRQRGGLVVSAAIKKYIFVTVNRKFDDGIRVSYSMTENVDRRDDLHHPLVRAAMTHVDIDGGIEITSVADIPAGGTGLGSSSSFTVGILHALNAYNGRYVGPSELAEGACHIEIDVCKEPIGKQDQYAAAFGGLNAIEFHADDRVTVSPVVCPQHVRQSLEEQILVFYTGRTRSASAILKTQTEKSGSNAATISALDQMVSLARDFIAALQNGRQDDLGRILHEGWELKRSLSPGITDNAIDDLYRRARAAGASGGKLLGAGGGGFLMFLVSPDKREAVIQALSELRLVDMPLSTEGSQIIFYQPSPRS